MNEDDRGSAENGAGAGMGAGAGRVLRRFRRGGGKGAAALEFALVMPLLLLILFGILAYGSVYFTLSSMKEGAQDAARRMAVGSASFSGSAVACRTAGTGTAEWYACRGLPGWGTYTVTAMQDCSAMDDKVVVATTGGSAAMVDVFGLVGRRDLSVVSIMRKEGKCP